MGPLFVLVPLVLQNVNVICKTVSFCVVLDNFLLKMYSFSFFGNQISKWRALGKRGNF